MTEHQKINELNIHVSIIDKPQKQCKGKIFIRIYT